MIIIIIIIIISTVYRAQTLAGQYGNVIKVDDSKFALYRKHGQWLKCDLTRHSENTGWGRRTLSASMIRMLLGLDSTLLVNSNCKYTQIDNGGGAIPPTSGGQSEYTGITGSTSHTR